jgi:hypothetical protein
MRFRVPAWPTSGVPDVGHFEIGSREHPTPAGTNGLKRPRRGLQPGEVVAGKPRRQCRAHPRVVGVDPAAFGVGEQRRVDQPTAAGSVTTTRFSMRMP